MTEITHQLGITTPHLSLVIPIHNEKDNIIPLVEAIEASFQTSSMTLEVIFVDDGSTDGSAHMIEALHKSYIRVIVFRRNYGQTSAMAAGIDLAQGQYIAFMDGDLQNNPADILMMCRVMERHGCDMVVGRRAHRQDGWLLRKFPSMIANWLIRSLLHVPVRDLGCSLKVMRADFAKQLDLYGELHRFIPILASMQGASMVEVDVTHAPRIYGRSKYGLGRTPRVMSDLLFMLFMQKYRQKPMHLFGTLGLSLMASGFAIESYLLWLKWLGHAIGGRPLFYLGWMALLMGLQFVTTGFVAEFVMRTYYESQQKRPFQIARLFDGQAWHEISPVAHPWGMAVSSPTSLSLSGRYVPLYKKMRMDESVVEEV